MTVTKLYTIFLIWVNGAAVCVCQLSCQHRLVPVLLLSLKEFICV